MPMTPTTVDPLRTSDARSLSPAFARVLRSLAGRVRALSEMVQGQSVKTGDQPIITRNPSGSFGIDLSGPPYGSAILHPLAWRSGLKSDTSGAGDWEGHRQVGTVTAEQPLVVPIVLWVKPYATSQDFIPPYSRGYPFLSMYMVNASATVTVTCRSTPGNDDTAISDDVVVSSSSETREAPNAWFNLRPGRNYVEMVLSTTSADGAVLCSWSVNQVAKRGH